MDVLKLLFTEKPTTLIDLLHKVNWKENDVQIGCDESQTVQFHHALDGLQLPTKLGIMTITDVYEDPYILACAVLDGVNFYQYLSFQK